MKSLLFCHSFKVSLVYGRFHVGYDTGRCDNRMYILKSPKTGSRNKQRSKNKHQ